MVKASIITIGDELLIGQVIDTNSVYISQALNRIGIPVVRRVAVGDDSMEITRALEEEQKHAGIIILTGGLGPTADDITKPCLCEYFGGKLVVNQEVLAAVKHRFEVMLKRPMGERNARQAEVPDVCEVIRNEVGTAPGMIFRKDSRIFISLPGVPHEMMHMLDTFVIPMLKDTNDKTIIHRTLLLMGIGESTVADMLRDFEKDLPASIKLAYLPDLIQLRLRLTAVNNSEPETDLHFSKMAALLEQNLVTLSDEKMEQVVFRLLEEQKSTVAIAESCTGGYIEHLLTSLPGASKIFNGGVVSYSNEAKMKLLGVKSETLERFGAVSEEVAAEMALGVMHTFNSDHSLAVSGIMGPGGGTETKPVGAVCIAAAGEEGVFTRTIKLNYNRDKNIRATAIAALNFLRQALAGQLGG